SGGRADCRPSPPASDRANGSAEAGASCDFSRGLLALAGTLRFHLGGGDLVLSAPERDRVRLQGNLVGPLEFPRLLVIRCLQDNGRLARKDHLAANHDWIIEDSFESHSTLRGIDVYLLRETDAEHCAHRHGDWRRDRRRIGRRGGWRSIGLARRKLDG